MPFDSSATPTTATNSATYLVNSRLRILVGDGSATGAVGASREASSARPCGASGCSEMLIPAKLARRNRLVSCRRAKRLNERDLRLPPAMPLFAPDQLAIVPGRPANSSGRDG